MLKKGLLFIFILVLSVNLVFALVPNNGKSTKSKPMTPCKIIGPNDNFTGFDNFPPTNSPLSTDDVIGETWVLGNTWYDIQHNSSCGRQIQLDDIDYVHVVWMLGEESGAINRHIYYQFVDPSGNLGFEPPLYPQMGVQVDLMNRAGYTTLAVHSDCRAVPTFHQGPGGDYNFHTGLGYDLYPYMGIFDIREPAYVWTPPPDPDDMEVIWPHIARDNSYFYHILSTYNPPAAGDVHGHYYIRGELDLLAYQVYFSNSQGDTTQELIAETNIIAIEPAGSPVSNRICIAWLEPFATKPDTSQYDNDIVFITCDDATGSTWTWSDTTNITNWIPPRPEVLPGSLATYIDTLFAHGDTLTAYDDVCPYFDSNDVLHVAFASRGRYGLEGDFLTVGNGYIFHWSEEYQELSVISNGWYANGGPYFDPGAWNVFHQRASLAEDPATGYLYCMYQRYITPHDTTLPFDPEFYLWADSADVSEAGYPNGEIWMTVSTDGGLTWAEGTNITNTPAPNAPAGECMSELTPSMALDIRDGYAHIFYILDRDAGAVVQNEGVWTDNEAIYHRVPVSEIPTTPLLQDLYDFPPFHVDTTMYAPTLLSYSPEFSTIYATPGDSYDFEIEAEDPNSAITYEWIQEVMDPSDTHIVDRFTLPGTSNSLTWTAPPEDSSYYWIIGRAHGYAYFNERQWKVNSSVGVDNAPSSTIPDEFSLNQNYPNPFNPATSIKFNLRCACEVSLKVYNIHGELVDVLVDGSLESGEHNISFDAQNLSSGIYFCKLTAQDFSQTRKMILMK